MASTLSPLLLLALVTASGGQRPGSAQFQVSVRVVAPLRASAPSVAELHRPASATRIVNGALPVSLAGGQGRDQQVVARMVPVVALRGGAPAVLVGVPGGPSRRCAEGGTCELALKRLAATAGTGETVVVTFLPDGAPSAIVER